MKTIFHLDLDTFFVSVERLRNPELIGKPVIVGANPKSGRGVIAACSYEARKFGLHSAMPITEAYRRCPQGIYLRGTMGEYVKYSKKVRRILEEYAPVIEQASVDEFYMDFSGTEQMYGDLFLFAKKLQAKILNELGLPASIGIGTNKNIAKICSAYAKPQGVLLITPGTEKTFLASLPVEVIPGVGKVMLQSLHAKRIFKVKDITKLSEKYFIDTYGKAGISLWNKANGGGSTEFPTGRKRLSVSKEKTFGTDELNEGKIEQTLFKLSANVCQQLRDKNREAATVGIKLRYSDFTTVTRAKTISPTNDDKTIFETVKKLFQSTYTEKRPVRLIGVHLSKLYEANEQITLFDEENSVRKNMLKAVTDIRKKFGYDAIKFGE